MPATIPPIITASPVAPQRNDKSTFSPRLDTWVKWTTDHAVTEFGEVAQNVYDNAQFAYSMANAANTSAGLAAQAVIDSQAAASAAATNGNATKWVSGTTYGQGAVTWSPSNGRSYRRKTAGSGTVDPLSDSTNWWPIAVSPTLIRSARTANAMLTAADAMTLIDITSGTFTQTFDTPANLGNGWYAYYRNSGTSDITLNPGGPLIDGVASGVIKPQMALLIQCDGSAFNVLRIDKNTITEMKTTGTSGTWPLGVRAAKLKMAGGGSSGIYGAWYPGASGGYLEKTLSVSPGTTYSYSIGSAGAAPASGTSATNAGGSTTFTYSGATYTANGGPSSKFGSVGGTAVNGDLNISGGAGVALSNSYSNPGGSNPLGMGGYVGQAGTGYGSGGGCASDSSTTAGAGRPGVIILEY